MAHVKGGTTTSLGRDSESKRLGIKLGDGQSARIGSIIVRQRGLKFRPGLNVARGEDDTLFAIANGTVRFKQKTIRSFAGHRHRVPVVSVIEKT